jgi:thioredoxin 1
MSVLPLTQDNFDSAVARSACLVVEFSDSVEDFSNRASQISGANGVEWGHVDLRTDAPLAATFGIASDHALLIFRDQVVLYLEAGKHDPSRIADLLDRIRALDMATVKAEIEAQKQAQLALRMRRVCPTARRRPIGG